MTLRVMLSEEGDPTFGTAFARIASDADLPKVRLHGAANLLDRIVASGRKVSERNDADAPDLSELVRVIPSPGRLDRRIMQRRRAGYDDVPLRGFGEDIGHGVGVQFSS